MKYGVSYYPEHKEQAEIAHDIALMKEAGINLVRMGEFAWCKFEPVEGQYDFAWLDPVVEELGANGIQTIICTPTACPPAWLVEKHPEILYVDNRGITRPFGGRRHYCYNNPVYRGYSRKIAEAIGAHYGGSPYVFAFQIDNELAQEGTGRCRCPVCRKKFQQWLEGKYGTIVELNRRMGTVFWGQAYDRFSQINLPVNTIEPNTQQAIPAFFENPSLRLDFERFCSDSNIEYQNIQRDALKKYTDKIVTTNATGLATNSIDYYKAFQGLDCYAFDYYPSLRDLEISSFPYAHARGVCGKDFWLLEFQSGGGHGLWGSGRLQPYPGALRQAAVHAFAAGADLVAHFQFRTFPFGAEQLNYAVVDIDGIPRRRFYEVQAAARDLKKLGSVLKHSRFDNEVAVCFDYQSLWALKIKPIAKDFNYVKFCTEIYQQLARLGVGADVIPFGRDLDKYKVVIVPAPIIMSDDFKRRLKQYVYNGGVLLSTFLAGIKNPDNIGIAESLPCGLTGLFGIRVGEVEPVVERTKATIALKTGAGETRGVNKYWAETLEPNGAEMIGVYADTFREGTGVISRNSYGNGVAYYLGTGVEPQLLGELAKLALKDGRVALLPFKVQAGMKVFVRKYDHQNLYCLFNFSQEPAAIKLDHDYYDVLNGDSVTDEIVLEPKGYRFLLD
ncbi:MAG: beta-galactosidase [Firmicutes bacterium]|nr:beta-galactosidase [Bacillota bacterium]NLL88828.1 beta-galactosidase [Bacillota bacterium]